VNCPGSDSDAGLLSDRSRAVEADRRPVVIDRAVEARGAGNRDRAVERHRRNERRGQGRCLNQRDWVPSYTNVTALRDPLDSVNDAPPMHWKRLPATLPAFSLASTMDAEPILTNVIARPAAPPARPVSVMVPVVSWKM